MKNKLSIFFRVLNFKGNKVDSFFGWLTIGMVITIAILLYGIFISTLNSTVAKGAAWDNNKELIYTKKDGSTFIFKKSDGWLSVSTGYVKGEFIPYGRVHSLEYYKENNGK